MSMTDLIPTLQTAIGPVILISGIGLILLSMTNRFARVIDRSRILSLELRDADEADRARILGELQILATRAPLVRTAIALAILSVFFAAVLIISLFLAALLPLHFAPLLVTLFVLAMIALIAALILFLRDIDHSLRALWMELPEEIRVRR